MLADLFSILLERSPTLPMCRPSTFLRIKTLGEHAGPVFLVASSETICNLQLETRNLKLLHQHTKGWRE